jgi:hypothetical protein
VQGVGVLGIPPLKSGLRNGYVPGSGFPPSELEPVLIMHEYGHAISGYPNFSTIVQPDVFADPLGTDISIENTIAIGDVCFPEGDGGQNLGPADDPSNQPVEATRKARKRF